MNSLLSGIGNSLMNNARTPMASAPQSPNILMQAFGAALRGESPQQFLSNLAQTHPQLKQYDFSNVQQAAQQVCQQNGVDAQSVVNQLDNITSSIM